MRNKRKYEEKRKQTKMSNARQMKGEKKRNRSFHSLTEGKLERVGVLKGKQETDATPLRLRLNCFRQGGKLMALVSPLTRKAIILSSDANS